VRKYIESKVGSDYLIPLLKAKKFITPSDFDSLPNEFVIKTSNGGGGENVLIVNNKNSLNLDEICDRFNNYLKVKIGKKIDEYFYDI
ncbi:ATP-grasp fold amidoligase family protein, partial [Proteus mirabilis]|nr:ATP-grasp fold amidoligase family protein [Proteus mirabilis]